ncbi:phytanoyl-CoA dioxygenase family protein [Nonomuraea insulae]|uniref:Phytanoyl-CoA dioxygenase family protein n=1 Tax=Nonomuraea insulae TaxID=1616787 RepID=A0ABW1D8K1_9ACTN
MSATLHKHLGNAQIASYYRDGYLLLPPEFLPAGSLDKVVAACPDILAERGPRTVLERDGVTVRSVYGPHQTSTAVEGFSKLPQLLDAAAKLLNDEVYIHQSKVNQKAAFSGDQWEWHQDYVYWIQNDGINSPNLVNVAVFLDEVTEFNGPLTFIPGSHREGVLAGTDTQGMPVGYEDAPSWVATLTATEKFQIDRSVIARLAGAGNLVSAKGPAGSVLLFHPNILHASLPNLSPFNRRVLILVYNAIGNPPTNTVNPRPGFLAARDTTAVRPDAG